MLLIFYFSGHSDGQALELGRERVTFDDLRRLLAQTNADVRVAIVDSCRSGALLAAKGGTAGPGYDIRLNDDLALPARCCSPPAPPTRLALESVDLRRLGLHPLPRLRACAARPTPRGTAGSR